MYSSCYKIFLIYTGSLTDQIQYLEEQKRLIEARQRQIQQAANGQQTLQQVSPQYDESRGYDGSHGYDEEERMLLMQMLGVDGNERYNDYGDEHFNKQEAKRTVDEMYHVKDGKKYIGEKYDMQKAHEVCSKFKDKLEDEVEVADVYVAINAQYHDYCELFEKWFGKGNFDDMIFESAISFWFDDVDFGEDKLWKYFNELK